MWNWLFGKKEKKTNKEVTEKQYLPGTRLSYDENLISKLTSDHEEMLAIYTSCAQAYEKKDYLKLNQLLNQLKSKLTSHLLRENVCFYLYVSHYYKEDESTRELINSFRREMEEIGKVAFKFLTESSAPDAVYYAEFKKNFDMIGSVLTNRIEEEESGLYMLYVPPPG